MKYIYKDNNNNKKEKEITLEQAKGILNSLNKVSRNKVEVAFNCAYPEMVRIDVKKTNNISRKWFKDLNIEKGENKDLKEFCTHRIEIKEDEGNDEFLKYQY